MSNTAQDIINGVSQIIQDPTEVRVTEAQWWDWITDAMRVICSIRPDACSSTENLSLTTNDAKQALPTGARRLIGITRNMGADGSTIGKAIRGPVPREVLDSFDPDWITTTGAYVKEYVYNPERPKEFFIFPVLTSAWYIELEVAKNPTAITDDADILDTDEAYAPQIITWCAYRALSRDSEESPNFIRAGELMNEFLTFFGIKSTADKRILPHLVEHGKHISS